MPELDNIEIRSDEVQEVLGHTPSKLVRYGIGVLLAIIIIIILGSFFFKYPDIIRAEFEIVTKNPPAQIFAKTNGDLSQIYVSDSQFVEANKLLGVIQNPAQTDDILRLQSNLPTIKNELFSTKLQNKLSNNLQLGNIQSDYSALYKAVQEYKQFIELKYYETKIASLQNKKKQLQEYLLVLKEQVKLKQVELSIGEKQFNRDSILFTKTVISALEYENAKKTLIQKEYEWHSQNSLVINTKLEISELEQSIVEHQLELQNQSNKHEQSLTELYNKLESSIAWWFDQYALVSPIEGTVAFNKIWSKNQHISAGGEVFSIISNEKQSIIGRVTVDSKGVGKIKPEQDVNLKFSNFPYQEFGMIRAKVKSISLVPVNNEYFIELALPKTLQTNYGILIPFSQKMSGAAEIITEDLPLIARIFNPIKDILYARVLEPAEPIETETKEDSSKIIHQEIKKTDTKDSTKQISPRQVNKGSGLTNSAPNYHVIVGSFTDENMANSACKEFTQKGYTGRILHGKNNKFRLSIYSSQNKEQAIKKLSQIRKTENDNNIWLLKQQPIK